MEFYKYEATGNDFILVDFCGGWNAADVGIWLDVLKDSAPRLCDRHFGIGADGIIVLAPSSYGFAYMHIINADGSMATMCGNGIRCAARYLYKRRFFNPNETLFIDTAGGLQALRFIEGDAECSMIDVHMARATVVNTCVLLHQNEAYEGTIIDAGNPHVVFEVENPRLSLEKSGAFLSNHPEFPDRTNVEFIAEIAPNVIDFAVYERGVGPTLSCGTGCVAAALAYAKKRQILRGIIEIHAPGGELYVVLENDEVHLQGPATFVFSGQWDDK